MTFLGISNRIIRLVSPGYARRRLIRRSAKQHDMVTGDSEQFFANLYLHFIRERIYRTFGRVPISILDAGCGQGRLSIPLTRDGHRVEGIDLSESAVLKAREYGSTLPVTFKVGDIEKDLAKIREGHYDCVICTEVLLMIPEHGKVIRDLVRIVRTGGLVIIGVRPSLFYVSVDVKAGHLEEALRTAKGATSLRGGVLNCHRLSEMRSLLENCGLKEITAVGIGVVSGIDGDPQILQPSMLAEEDQKLLEQIELTLASEYPENGRYILMMGRK
jgi:SAM-dependent methyltransferase